jgi:cytochrome c-type biogenesis protein
MIMTFAFAFLGGIFTFFSPCVLPLLPAYLSMISGLSIEDLSAIKNPLKILKPTLLFILGFSLVFIFLGASATLIGQFLITNLRTFKMISGAIVIILALDFLDILSIPILKRTFKPRVESSSPFILGIVFSFGWTPCVGPVLASILLLAAATETVGRGIQLLIFYSLGMAIPFIILSFSAVYILKLLKNIPNFFNYVLKIAGIFLLVFGILLVFGAV